MSTVSIGGMAKAETREQIRAAAWDLFKSKGFVDKVDDEKTSAVMRPSKTFNEALAAF